MGLREFANLLESAMGLRDSAIQLAHTAYCGITVRGTPKSQRGWSFQQSAVGGMGCVVTKPWSVWGETWCWCRVGVVYSSRARCQVGWVCSFGVRVCSCQVGCVHMGSHSQPAPLPIDSP